MSRGASRRGMLKNVEKCSIKSVQKMLKNMKKPLEKCFFAMVVAWRLATDFRGRVFFVARRLATRHVLKTFVFMEALKTSASRLGFGDTESKINHFSSRCSHFFVGMSRHNKDFKDFE